MDTIKETKPEISFKEAILFWLKLGFISFGGPAGQNFPHASRTCRTKKMDFRKTFYACIKLLHAVTWA